jgi:hypothetical protein
MIPTLIYLTETVVVEVENPSRTMSILPYIGTDALVLVPVLVIQPGHLVFFDVVVDAFPVVAVASGAAADGIAYEK